MFDLCSPPLACLMRMPVTATLVELRRIWTIRINYFVKQPTTSALSMAMCPPFLKVASISGGMIKRSLPGASQHCCVPLIYLTYCCLITHHCCLSVLHRCFTLLGQQPDDPALSVFS